jgi:lipoprotein-releasing system permease protein
VKQSKEESTLDYGRNESLWRQNFPYLREHWAGLLFAAFIGNALSLVIGALVLPRVWGGYRWIVALFLWIVLSALVYGAMALLDRLFERIAENNYKSLLIGRYLRKRRIAWVSLIAVMLCTAMVLVVISVMGGWLRMFNESFHGISGDIIVHGRSETGFPDYQLMIDKIKALPEVKAAVPVVRAVGLANFNGSFSKGVQVIGYPPNIGEVNGFADSLYRLKGTKNLTFDLLPDVQYFPPGQIKADVTKWKGIIPGGALIGVHKDESGEFVRPPGMYNAYVDLTLLPISTFGSRLDLTAKSRSFYWIIDDSRSKVSIQDANTVYMAFDTLQRELQMDAADDRPARTSDIQVALKPGVDLESGRKKIEQVVMAVKNRNIPAGVQSAWDPFPVEVQTWKEVHEDFIRAVEKEKGLVTILFGLISIVAVFLIFCIFYMIVVEKTRDIGIIKSVGATSGGIASIFLGYGMAIGIVGGMAGLGAGWLIVHYINQLHEWLGKISGGKIVMWDPKVYLFDLIPNTIDAKEATIIVIVAIISSVLGARVPAVRAGRMHPIEALRWE